MDFNLFFFEWFIWWSEIGDFGYLDLKTQREQMAGQAYVQSFIGAVSRRLFR